MDKKLFNKMKRETIFESRLTQEAAVGQRKIKEGEENQVEICSKSGEKVNYIINTTN